MDRGLSSKYIDKVHPVDNHFDHMEKIGAKSGLINPNLNRMTSDVIKVCALNSLALKMKITLFHFFDYKLASVCYFIPV